MQPLSKTYHVVAPDNRGYAFSEKPENISDYEITTLVEDLRQLIVRLSNNKKVIIVGHDWGGVLTWGIAQQHPKLISKMIIINAPPFNAFIESLHNNESQRKASKYVPKMTSWIAQIYLAVKGAGAFWGEGLQKMHAKGDVDDKFKEAFYRAWDQPGAIQSAIHWYRVNFPAFDDINESTYWPPRQASLENKIKVPSLLIWSKDDKAFTDDTFNEIPKFVDNMQIKIIDTDSHAPQLDQSEEVLGYIVDFLQPSK